MKGITNTISPRKDPNLQLKVKFLLTRFCSHTIAKSKAYMEWTILSWSVISVSGLGSGNNLATAELSDKIFPNRFLAITKDK